MSKEDLTLELRMEAFLVLLLALLPQMACMTHILKCGIHGPHPPLRKYHQSGDLILGVIASQASIASSLTDFTEEAGPTLFENLM